jgi:hypothetical protein
MFEGSPQGLSWLHARPVIVVSSDRVRTANRFQRLAKAQGLPLQTHVRAADRELAETCMRGFMLQSQRCHDPMSGIGIKATLLRSKIM